MVSYRDHIHNVLNRMRDAYEQGHGMRISAEEMQALNTTVLAEMWSELDPRIENKEKADD